jgi:hypothetical protein
VGARRLQHLAEKVEHVAEQGDPESVRVLVTAMEEAHRNACAELILLRGGAAA